MNVMQKLYIGKLSNHAHIIFTLWLLVPISFSATWATTNKTTLFYPGCVSMQKT